VLVNGLVTGLGYTSQQAMNASSASAWGAALGSLVTVFAVRHFRWKPALAIFLIGMLALDLLSAFVTDPTLLTAIRLLHGCLGGGVAGYGFSVIARTRSPDRAFALLLLLQLAAGGLTLLSLEHLVTRQGPHFLFLPIMLFSLAGLCLLPFLDDYTIPPQRTQMRRNRPRIRRRPLLLVLTALFLFQMAISGLYANVLPLARSHGLSPESGVIATQLVTWFGVIGAALALFEGNRAGYFKPVFYGTVLTALASTAYVYSFIWPMFVAASVVIGVTWSFVLVYLFGLVSRFDERGHMAALGCVTSIAGLIAGPFVLTRLSGGESYTPMIAISALLLFGSAIAAWRPLELQDKEGVHALVDPRKQKKGRHQAPMGFSRSQVISSQEATRRVQE